MKSLGAKRQVLLDHMNYIMKLEEEEPLNLKKNLISQKNDSETFLMCGISCNGYYELFRGKIHCIFIRRDSKKNVEDN